MVTPWEIFSGIQIPDKKTVVSNWEISGENIPLYSKYKESAEQHLLIRYYVSQTIIDHYFVCISVIGDHEQAHLLD